MKIFRALLMFVTAASLGAADLPTAQLLRIGERPVTPVTGSVIAGRKTTLLFHYTGPAEAEIAADLLQVSGNLAAPWMKDLPLHGDPLALDLELPPLARESTLLLILRSRPRAGEPWQALGKFSLAAFPADLSQEMAQFARELEKERGLKLAVFGAAGPLHEFLRASGVDFVDLGAEMPSSLPEPLLVLGSAAFSAKERANRLFSPASPGVLFASDTALLPGVYPQRGGGLTLVTLPVLSDLPKDPRQQKTFLEILRIASAVPLPTP